VESYLNAPRERSPEVEISMKFSLAHLLYQSGDKAGAITLLQAIPVPAENAEAAVQQRYRGLANVLKQMQAGTYSAGI
jgi:hypothetical protein